MGPVKGAVYTTVFFLIESWIFLGLFLFGKKNEILRPTLIGSELRSQNFALVKFREIIPRNPCHGTFLSWNFEIVKQF